MNLTELRRKAINETTTGFKQDQRGISYEAFTNVPKVLQLTEKDIDKRIWKADSPRTSKLYLVGIKEDSVEVKERGHPFNRHFYKDEVILHPSELTKSRFDER